MALPDYLWGIETRCNGEPLHSGWELPDYLWGIETAATVCKLPHIAPLPDYLWGIETSIVVVVSSSLNALPDYLWGIETFFAVLNITFWGFASRLPMRNWNPGPWAMKKRLRELPDYLWGIETRLENDVGRRVFRFQTTYEELKHGLWSIVHGLCSCFQTTYEELKPK